MAPRNVELDIWSGNTKRQKFRFRADGNPFDLTGSKLVFRATLMNGSGAIRKTTSDVDSGFAITDAEGGEVELFFTVTETREMPAGEPAYKYEIERWIGDDQTSLLYGGIKVTKWVNDDVDP